MFQGLYINLDRRGDRRERIEREFARFGLSDRYRRLAATPAEVPADGCYSSHLAALEEARKEGGIVHILEDDSILSPQLAPFLESDRLAGLLQTLDIVFLDMWLDPRQEAIDRYLAAMAGPNVVTFGADPATRIAAMSSYVVAPRSLDRVIDALKKQRGEKRPVDTTLNRLVRSGEISAGVVVPFLTGVEIDVGSQSDIQRLPELEQRKFIMLRTRFFVDPSRQPHL